MSGKVLKMQRGVWGKPDMRGEQPQPPRLLAPGHGSMLGRPVAPHGRHLGREKATGMDIADEVHAVV
jgi:hypothetical protein